MPSHRNLRVAEAIREVVATAILFEVADPRVRGVTVVRVEVTADFRHCIDDPHAAGVAIAATTAPSGRGSCSGSKR